MSWTSPKTWVTGSVVTASELNTHLRDNLLETASAKVTTAGDLTYATGANALARLAAGTSAQVLHGGTTPSWSAVTMAQLETQPYCRAYRSTNQSLTDGAIVTLNLDAETYDGPGWHDNSTNNSRITPTIAGRYLVIASVGFKSNANGYRQIYIQRNGDLLNYTTLSAAIGSSVSDISVHLTDILYFNGSTDYIELLAYQNSGGSLNVSGSETVTFLAVTKLAGTG